MKSNQPTYFLFFLSIFFCSSLCLAVETINPSSSQTNPLDITNPFGRASAMGSAFVGVADDASALFSNPSGLSSLQRGEIAFNSDIWLVNTFVETADFGIPLGNGWGLGLGFNYLDYGTFEGRDETGSLSGTYTASRWNATSGFGYEVTRGLALGVRMLFDESNFAGSGSSLWSGSIGALWDFSPRLRLGAACNNLLSSTSAGSAESSFELGFSSPIPLSPQSRLLAAASGTYEPNAVSYLQAGLEFSLNHQFYLQAGFQQALEDNSVTGFTNLTAGIGLELSDIFFDYAYLPYGDLGDSHRVTIGYLFGSPPVQSSPTSTPSPIKIPTPSFSPTPQPSQAPATLIPNSLTVQFDVPTSTVAAGKILEKEGKYKQASDLYIQAVQENPKDESAWIALASLYEHLNKRDYAIQCYEQALSLDPNNQDLIDHLKNLKTETP
jgi:tetratricopeptide (TPR) repeat protein